VPQEIRVYRIPRRQTLFAVGVVFTFLVCASLIFEPDPASGVVSKPSDYIWPLIPSALLAIFLTWRAWRTRVETTAGGVVVHHVLSRETIPWDTIDHFEVHPTPSRRGSAVLARTTLGRLTRVRTWVAVRRGTDHRSAALAFRDALEADRHAREGTPAPRRSGVSAAVVAAPSAQAGHGR
jgi:hypothetical protein